MSGLIWIQPVWYSDRVLQIIFWKSLFWKASAGDNKSIKNYPACKDIKTVECNIQASECYFVNLQALWMMEPKEITEDMHEEFYRFVANVYDKPRYHIHYKADAPLNIRALFYIPEYKPSKLSVIYSQMIFFLIIPGIRILRLTLHKKTASKYWIRQIIGSLNCSWFILRQYTI